MLQTNGNAKPCLGFQNGGKENRFSSWGMAGNSRKTTSKLQKSKTELSRDEITTNCLRCMGDLSGLRKPLLGFFKSDYFIFLKRDFINDLFDVKGEGRL